ncbi:hypothetical protein [Haloplasma contractile]|uniref:Membrane lipoprotein n=1 Tax=Haloplasma contractile SSD-17B TaxID=1033810 RepID=U2E8D8_9MOLU|nr:hypothetical protein [Haloplasma contractile]ERJ11156.1 membrane lipoprotein [Haloplasma contractile SSD-17B]
MLKGLFSMIILVFLSFLVGCEYIPLPTDETSEESTEVGRAIQEDSEITFSDYLERFNSEDIFNLLPKSFYNEKLVKETRGNGMNMKLRHLLPQPTQYYAIENSKFLRNYSQNLPIQVDILQDELVGVECCNLGETRIYYYEADPISKLYQKMGKIIAIIHLIDGLNEQLLLSEHITLDEKAITISNLNEQTWLIPFLEDVMITVNTKGEELTIFYEGTARQEMIDDWESCFGCEILTDLQYIDDYQFKVRVTMSKYSDHQFKTTITTNIQEHNEHNNLLNDREEAVVKKLTDQNLASYIKVIDDESLLMNTNYSREYMLKINQEYGPWQFNDEFTTISTASDTFEIKKTGTEMTLEYKIDYNYNSDLDEGNWGYINDRKEQQIHAVGNDQSGYVVTKFVGEHQPVSGNEIVQSTITYDMVTLYNKHNELSYTGFTKESQVAKEGVLNEYIDSGYLLDMRLLTGWTKAHINSYSELTLYNHDKIIFEGLNKINHSSTYEKKGIQYIYDENLDAHTGLYYEFKEDTLDDITIPEGFVLEQVNKINYVNDQLGQLKEIDLSDDRYLVPELADDSE